MSAIEKISNFTARTSYNDIPKSVLEQAKVPIRDYMGVAIHGSGQEIGEIIQTYVNTEFSGEDSTVFGGTSASSSGAALANGTFGHAIDYDDTFESIAIHPTSPIFSAALAVGEAEEATSRDVLTAYVIGSEVAFNIEMGLLPSHYDKGWHSTGTTGSFGATAAAGSVLGLDVEELQEAFGIVGSASSSLRKNFGSMTKPLHAGHAAQMGVRAATLSQAGFTADNQIFSGDLGYGTVMTGEEGYDESATIEGLSDNQWAVMEISFKPYPSGALTHAPMEALRRLVRRENISPDEVRSITVSVDKATEGVLLHEDPKNALQAKFSLEFCMAIILCERDATIYEFRDEMVQSSEIQDQMKKVERNYEKELFDGDYSKRGGRVKITMTDGTVYEEGERFTPGTPTNPIDDKRLKEKFVRCVESVIDGESAEEILENINRLDQQQNKITNLTSIL
jgi:2-methylcitrate dehydratase PrpD